MRRFLLLTGVAVVVLAAISGCTFLALQSRIDQFVDDLNAGSRSQLYLNLDPSLSDYNSLKDPAYWDGWFPLVGADTPYSLSGQQTNNPGDGTATVTAELSGPSSFFGPKTLVVGLVQTGFEWYIHTMTLEGFDVVPYSGP